MSNFVKAKLYFSLVHFELMTYQSQLLVEDTLQKASELAAISQQNSASTEEVTASTQQISSTFEKVKDHSMKSLETLNDSLALKANVFQELDTMENNLTDLVQDLEKIEGVSNEVGSIADQTNLLSLNAAIEAARAGEHGRGFSVVAEEVRKLAGQTKNAVKEVTSLSKTVNKKSQETFDSVKTASKTFETYLGYSELIGQGIKENNEQVIQVNESVQNISLAMAEQARVSESLSNLASMLAETDNFGVLMREETSDLKEIVMSSLELQDDDSCEYMLAARLIDHAKFLQNIIKMAGSKQRVTTHNECAFGKWYNSKRQELKHLQEFRDIDLPHQEVHLAAQKVIDKPSIENVQGLIKASLNILYYFDKLNKNLSSC